MEFSIQEALESYKVPKSSARLGLLALGLRFELDDLTLVADRALTDGPNDKKCDVVFIDDISQTAVIIQDYESNSTGRSEAPANKATDLNAAASWILNSDLTDVPLELQPQFADVRDGLVTGRIRSLEFWYVHNLPESTNVKTELSTVERTAFASLRTSFPSVQVDIVAREVGFPTLENWWRSLQADIAVQGMFSIPVTGAYVETGSNWEAVIASVSAGWLRDIFTKYKTDLFKGNIRDYLGLRDADANINSGIRQTARETPEHLFVYNNGISIITQTADVSPDSKTLTIDGISIVNGAQTTGVLGNLDAVPNESARVQARFIATKNKDLVQNIIRFNNSQNRVEPADFRSTDPIQTRLREEFGAQFPTIRYLGGRRGGASDAIRRDSLLIDSTEVAKALAAFHGLPTLAYNRVKDLWADENYVKIFPPDITARHIVFVYSLYRALGAYKSALGKIPDDQRTTSQKDQIELFRSGSSFFSLLAGIAQSIEPLLGKAIFSKYSLHFKESVTSMEEMIVLWQVPLQSSAPFLKKFRGVIDERLINETTVKAVLEDFSSSFEAVSATLGSNLGSFRDHVSS